MATRKEKLLRIRTKLECGEELTTAEEKLISEKGSKPKTLNALAKEFGVIQRTICNWQKIAPPGTFKKGADGYDIEAIKAWRRQHMVATKQARILPFDGETDDGDGLYSLRHRKDKAIVNKLELQVSILAGKFVSVEVVLAQVRVVMYRWKERFLRLAEELSYDVVGVTPADAEERIRTAVESGLREMSETDYFALEKKLTEATLINGVKVRQVPKARIYNKERPY